MSSARAPYCKVETDARLLAARLSDQISDLKSDVTVLIPSVALDQLVRAQAASQQPIAAPVAKAAYQRIATFLNGQLARKPSYLQVSIIGIDDGGREILRIERGGINKPLRLVPQIELQRRGSTHYFRHTMALRSGEIHISPIEFINAPDERGSAQTIPVLRATTPIFIADGSFMGIIAIAVEMRSAFDAIRSREQLGGIDISSSRRIYLINHEGEFLLHPEPNRELGAKVNIVSRITDEIHGLSALIGTDRPRTLMVTDAHGSQFGAAVVPLQPAQAFWMAVVELVPRTEIMAPIFAVQRAAIAGGISALVCAIVLAALLARSIARPLVQMRNAVESFVPESSFQMPESAMRSTDEVGILARSFDQMVSRINGEIKERERLLDELRDTYARQHAIFANAVDGILTLDERGKIESVNPAAERMFGVTAKSASGLNISALFELAGPHGASLFANLFNAVAAASTSHEMTARRSDGTTFPADILLTQMTVRGRQMLLLFVRDATARKVADERFRKAVEASPSGMVMVDRSGIILLVNTATEKLFRYDRDELLGKSMDMLVPERCRARHLEDRMAFFDNPQGGTMGRGCELYGLRKDGSEFPIEVGLNRIRMRDGSTVILSAINDVSERKRTEQMKDEFVAMVSHELRTPLTSITASLALLAADQTLPDPAKRLLAIAHSNSQRLVRLINDILDLEKIESGKVEFDMRTVEIRPLVEQAIEANRGFADQFNVRLSLDSQSANFTASVDIDRLMQVITNLLSNAVKYSPNGGEVVVTTKVIGDTGRIAVRDNGPGIPEKFKSRIFEHFAQADSCEAREKGGTGLGLSIVKQIMLRLGGEANFEAAPGGGTIFYVDLPRAEVTSSNSPKRGEQQIREVA
jgi:PAS domain S-box-containing protein